MTIFDRQAACRIAVVVFLLGNASAIAKDIDVSDLDKNGNADGYLQLSEIPVDDRQAVAVYAGLVGLDMRHPMLVSRLVYGRSLYRKTLETDRLLKMQDDTPGKFEFGRPQESNVRGFGSRLPYGIPATRLNQTRGSSIMRYVDANRDGYATPKEVLESRYSVYLERWFKNDLDRDNRLSAEELSLYYYDYYMDVDTDEIREKSTWKIEGIEVTPSQRRVAESLMRKYDSNRDGYADMSELPADWTAGWTMDVADINGDNRLHLHEFYVLRAVYERKRTLGRAVAANRTERDEELLDAADDLADFLIPLHTRGEQRDRVLRKDTGDLEEFSPDILGADLNRNGAINSPELRDWLSKRIALQRGIDLPPDLPMWFVESDLDQDRQVMLEEYLSIHPADSIGEFDKYDVDGDGIVSATESSQQKDDRRVVFRSETPMFVPGGTLHESELFLRDDLTIEDIDVEIGIAKKDEDNIDLRLIGPDGSVAMLLMDSRKTPWRSGRFMRFSILDDEAPSRQLPRPPLNRTWRPQSVGRKDVDSLDVFYGKQTRGRWAFVIENNTDEACLLEGWAIRIRPEEEDETLDAAEVQ